MWPNSRPQALSWQQRLSDHLGVRVASLLSFISFVKLPLEESLITSPAPACIPCHRLRVCPKSMHRDPNPEKQAKRVHETFDGPPFASKQATMHVLFPWLERAWAECCPCHVEHDYSKSADSSLAAQS